MTVFSMRMLSLELSNRISRSMDVSFSLRNVLRAFNLPPYMSLSAVSSPTDGAISTVFRMRSRSMLKVTSCALTSNFATSSVRVTDSWSAMRRFSISGYATHSSMRRFSNSSRSAVVARRGPASSPSLDSLSPKSPSGKAGAGAAATAPARAVAAARLA